MIAAQPAITVAVNDRRLPVAAVMEHGRVLVPFRAVVEALGGRVSQFRLPLPPPARIIAGRTYAPIRYLANVVHAQIEYDGHTHLVQVFTTAVAASGTQPAASPTPTGLAAENPTPGSRVGSAYPTISASLPIAAGSAISRLTMLLDGADVTLYAQYSGSFVTFIPRDGLPVGTHTVAINGVSTDGTPFNDSWTFETTRPPATDIGGGSNGLTPISLDVFGTQFVGGSPIDVQLTAPPGGQAFAFVCTSGYQFPLYAAPSSQFYSGSIRTRDVGSAIDCSITAMYVGWNGAVTYAPYPVFVHLVPRNTPQPSPSASPTHVPRPAPVATRTPEPIQTQLPAMTPRPAVTPEPKPTATPEPKPTETPSPRPPRRRLPIEREPSPHATPRAG